MNTDFNTQSTSYHIYKAFKALSYWLFRIALWCLVIYSLNKTMNDVIINYLQYIKYYGDEVYKYGTLQANLDFMFTLRLSYPGMIFCSLLGVLARIIQLIAYLFLFITEKAQSEEH